MNDILNKLMAKDFQGARKKFFELGAEAQQKLIKTVEAKRDYYGATVLNTLKRWYEL